MAAELFDNLFLSVGAMKAGTTWMHRVLELHPEIYFTPEKEIHYFAHAYVPGEAPLSPQGRLNRARAHTAIDPQRSQLQGARARLLWAANYLADPIDDLWYKNLFLFRRKQTYCADFSNLYALIEKPGWDRMNASVGRLRVMYTMRDPVKRLWSHAKFHSQFIGKQDAVAGWTPKQAEEFLRRDFMWKHAEYGQIVRRLRGALGEDQLRLYFFEELHKDQRAWLRDVETFLGIAHHDYPEARLSARVNESFDAPMPDWFPGIFRKDVERIYRELDAEGLTPPQSWLSQFENSASVA
ncbi:sulfotransferase domain-containing protein [Lutibaculum baratangense]|nr:sulfotransferase domain-containing protein [Lutibaculum baratangense]